MKKEKTILSTLLACFLGIVIPAEAATGRDAPVVGHLESTDDVSVNQQEEKRMLSPGIAFFVPHWYMKAQFGGAYDVGEAKFTQLVSPAAFLSFGYQPQEHFGLRANFGGIWARNQYAYPEASYQWNFFQGTIDAELNLTSLFLGSDPERDTRVYGFLGAGLNFSFNNDDAVAHDKRYGVTFQKLWKDTRWNPVIRAGLGIDYNVTENIAIGAEANVNLLPDHFNSKLGKHDNKDWHFNALVGIKFNFGKSYGRTDAIYEQLSTPAVEPRGNFVDVPVENISFNVNIYFLINQSIIRSNQISKLTRLLDYLDRHPKAFVRLSGYADKDTGTPEINMRLSRERAQVVSKYLQDAGIEEWRIRRFAKGDRVQPFDIPEDNRVCICYVYDPDNPVRQDNW